jgi:hypothetical protein
MRYILLLLLLSGCYTKKGAIDKFCNESVKTDTLIRVDTIKVVTPKDSIILTNTVPCEDFNIKDSTNLMNLEVSVKNGVITAKAECLEDTLYIQTSDTLFRERVEYREATKSKWDIAKSYPDLIVYGIVLGLILGLLIKK